MSYISSINHYINMHSSDELSEIIVIHKLLREVIIAYKNVLHNSLNLFFLGNRTCEFSENNDITTVDKSLLNNINTDDNLSTVSIDTWTLLLNDMFILGIIDKRCEVHLATPRINLSIYLKSSYPRYQRPLVKTTFKDNNSYYLTYYAREIIGLLISGYKIQNTGMGEVMVPPKKYIKLTLVRYVKAIEYFQKTGVSILTLSNLCEIKFNLKENRLDKIILR